MLGDFHASRERFRSRFNKAASSPCPAENPDGLAITVLFTTTRGTLHALEHAARLSHELQARIQIVVPFVVPYPLPIEKASVHPRFRLRELIAQCEQQPVEIRIDIWLCRDVSHCIQDGLLPNSLVVMGGRRSWWPLTYTGRLARQLRIAGHQVIFVAGEK